VKLLLDENLSPKLPRILSDAFPGSAHVDPLGLRGATDAALWNLARERGFAIVSKDNDFRQRAFLYGTPPKVIWLSVGNAGTDVIAGILLGNQERLSQFLADVEEGLLVLQAPMR
jgi:predicted nuclease of predicted toxin-antitoxin system